MIHPKEAQQILIQALEPLPKVIYSLQEALGHVLAADVPAPVDLPLFNQSAMDGYAVRFDEVDQRAQFLCIGEVKAGDTQRFDLKPGQCVRIFTGALTPPQADCVVMQEKATRHGELVSIEPGELKPGNNIRYQGSQIKKGMPALGAGLLVTPAAIGMAASMGISTLKVIRKPVVSVLVTGSELRPPGSKIKPGEIFESNLQTLQAALIQNGVQPNRLEVLPDTENIIADAIESSLNDADIVVLSGGISVGDYDFVGKALKRLGVKALFYKVAQKPGKPLFVGIRRKKLIVALPGNPASSLTCFYEYVLPAIRRMSGNSALFLPVKHLPLLSAFANNANRAVFLKATMEARGVQISEGQNSDMLHSFAYADALVYIPEFTSVEQGQLVETHILPHARIF